MHRAPLLLILLATATPALAQGLPAIEGEGSQTQSLELLQDSVTVTVESSGSVSLGRGNDSVGGTLGISVNDLTVGTTGRDNTAPDPVQGQNADGSVSRPTTATISGTDAGRIGSGIGAPACDWPLPNAGELAVAIRQGFQLMLEETACMQGVEGVPHLLASDPSIPAFLESKNLPPETVVSITIDNDTVILHHIPRS